VHLDDLGERTRRVLADAPGDFSFCILGVVRRERLVSSATAVIAAARSDEDRDRNRQEDA
jgi:hypothetical protein